MAQSVGRPAAAAVEIPHVDPATVKVEVQLKAARRELAMRQRAYPRWVPARMTAQKAGEEIAAMAAIVATLERLDAADRLI